MVSLVFLEKVAISSDEFKIFFSYFIQNLNGLLKLESSDLIQCVPPWDVFRIDLEPKSVDFKNIEGKSQLEILEEKVIENKF